MIISLFFIVGYIFFFNIRIELKVNSNKYYRGRGGNFSKKWAFSRQNNNILKRKVEV
jgi:hypothetical protein